MSKRTAQSTFKPATPPLADNELAVAAGEELVRQYQEWQQSFQPPAKRMAFIRHVCDRIAAEFQPKKIILFGSHAYGTQTSDSDLDLLVVMSFEGSPLSQAVKITRQLKLMLPIDLIVRTPAQLNERLAMDDSFMREIVERGKVMYEAAHQ
jgi:uncharacterized protein